MLLSLLCIGCSEQQEKPSVAPYETVLLKDTVLREVPENIVLKSAVEYDPKKTLWTLNHEPYSGFVVSYYDDCTMKEKFGMLNGKKQGQNMQWYPDGHLKNVSHYDKGKLHGEKRLWSGGPEHILIAQYQYDTGKAHGEQKKWYPTGELYKKLNLVRGKEEGLQQAFRKNGALYANYEARAGRIFGMKKATLCYGLDAEKVRYKKR